MVLILCVDRVCAAAVLVCGVRLFIHCLCVYTVFYFEAVTRKINGRVQVQIYTTDIPPIYPLRMAVKTMDLTMHIDCIYVYIL